MPSILIVERNGATFHTFNTTVQPYKDATVSHKFSIVRKRARNVYASHRARAAKVGASLNYSEESLRKAILDALGMPCRYCSLILTAENFSVDHCTPTSRQGSYNFCNLYVCCMKCNQAKGSLTADEFQGLLNYLQTLCEHARKNTIARLRSGWRANG